jgi:hypothetical protein
VGRFPYSACVRLIGYAGNYWAHFDGGYAARGLDPFDLPFNRFLNAIYYFIVGELTRAGQTLDAAVKALDEQLAVPLPGMEIEVTDDVIEQEMALFMAAQASR